MKSAASRRALIAFESRVYQSDGYGNTRGDWEVVFYSYCTIQPRFGGEEVTTARLSGRQPATITVRSHEKSRLVDPAWRLREMTSGAIWNVRSLVNTDMRNRWIEMFAETGTGVAT